jgi:uncharacterized protein
VATTAPPPFLTARWRSLAMLNYPADPEILSPLVPTGTELDVWNGRTFLSMVGFLFLDTRVRGLAIPYHRNFEEVNLRFYVRRRGPEGWRRGVVFVREIVPRWAIAATARLFYGEKYGAMPMRHSITGDPTGGGLSVTYGWRWRGRWNRLGGVACGGAREAEPGSEEEFITEHYWGYSSLRGSGTVEYRVEHPRWRVWTLERPVLDCDAASLYGRRFADPLSGAPSSAFLADGSAVTVSRGVRIA